MNEHYQPKSSEEPIAVARARLAGLSAPPREQNILVCSSPGPSNVANVSSTSGERRVAILTLGPQVLWDDVAAFGDVHEHSADKNSLRWITSFRACTGSIDLMRAILNAQEDYLVFSPRNGLIWDPHLVCRVERELAAFEELGVPWLCLCSDGKAFDGAQYSAAFFEREPSVVPDRGRRLIVQSAGSIYAIKVSNFRTLGVQVIAAPDLVHFMNNIIVIGYGRGFGSFFTSGLYPCLAEARCLSYVGVEEELLSLDICALMHPLDAYELFPSHVSRLRLLGAWVETLSSALSVRHLFSFVIRTLFRRQHLLRRCLISIEYIRRSLGMSVEIVLASDVDEAEVEPALNELSAAFPHMTFVTARGSKSDGYSRVRNLIAGLKKTTGTRVCIIDDDDYYTPAAASIFTKACEFQTEQLVIFDTQIVVEKWSLTGIKHHNEIVRYGCLFDAKFWATTLRGQNSIPLCGIIHPGSFIREVVRQYVYDFDFSEDFVFHLVCLTHQKRPPITIVQGVGAYQSHRVDGDNVTTAIDRTKWTCDTGNGLYQLLCIEGRTLDVISAGEVNAGEVSAHEKVRNLEAVLARSKEASAQATEALARVIGALSGGIS